MVQGPNWGLAVRNTFKNHATSHWTMPPPDAVTFSLVEALAGAHLGELRREVMVVLAGSLLITAGWFFL